MSSLLHVAIIGAGPYGLSLAAQLRAAGVEFRIFGRPMRLWQAHMPPGMFLKSDAPSSNLSAPEPGFTLESWRRERGLPYDPREPVGLADFIRYGLDFQRRFVPDLEEAEVVAVDREKAGYVLRLSTGEMVHAARVVVAVGVEPFKHVPEMFRTIDPALWSHSSAFGPVSHLAGKSVAVVGSGASAIDLAAALNERRVSTTLVSRRAEIPFQSTPVRTTLLQRMMRPDTGIGGGWKLFFCANAPDLVRMLPASRRVRMVRNYLGPAPGWFMRDRLAGVTLLRQQSPLEVSAASDGRVRLSLSSAEGPSTELTVDHVVAATGYRVDVSRLRFLAPALQAGLRTVGEAPQLSADFESSAPGLYFIGPAAAMSFGPLMRFVFGADFTVRRVARHLSQDRVRHVAPVPAMASP